MSKKLSKADQVKHEQDYIQFLEKRLASKNFLANAKPEEVETTKAKLKKARFVLKTLQA